MASCIAWSCSCMCRKARNESWEFVSSVFAFEAGCGVLSAQWARLGTSSNARAMDVKTANRKAPGRAARGRLRAIPAKLKGGRGNVGELPRLISCGPKFQVRFMSVLSVAGSMTTNRPDVKGREANPKSEIRNGRVDAGTRGNQCRTTPPTLLQLRLF